MDYHKAMNDLAAALGGDWEPRGKSGCDGQGFVAVIGRINLWEGLPLYVNAGGYGLQDRVKISAAYPPHVTGRGGVAATVQRDFDREVGYAMSPLEAVTASLERDPAAIARDIDRRYITKYRPLYHKAVAWCAEQLDYYTRRDETRAAADALAKQTHGVRIEYAHADSVDVKLNNVTIEQLEAICKIAAPLAKATA